LSASRCERIALSPSVPAATEVLVAIRQAKLLVLCPGDLYSSILPTLLPRGIRTAIAASRAPLALVLNIMTKQGETHGYRAEDFIARVEAHAGRRCDVIVANSSPVPRAAAAAYAVERKVGMATAELARDRRVRALPLARLTADGLLYHDPRALARALRALLK